MPVWQVTGVAAHSPPTRGPSLTSVPALPMLISPPHPSYFCLAFYFPSCLAFTFLPPLPVNSLLLTFFLASLFVYLSILL